MLKLVVTIVCAVVLAGLGFAVANALGADKAATPAKASPAADPNDGIGCPGCCHPGEDDDAKVVTAAVAATDPAPATQKAVDVKNTKCPVTGDDVGSESFEYNGKIYHICCHDCIKDFKKDPDKYIKAMAADPAKYGIPK